MGVEIYKVHYCGVGGFDEMVLLVPQQLSCLPKPYLVDLVGLAFWELLGELWFGGLAQNHLFLP